MKVAIVGATGMIGSAIAAEATARGHEVTAVSRRGGQVPGVDGVTSIAGELGDSALMQKLAADNDAVILATGPSRTGGDHQEWVDASAVALNNLQGTRILMVGGAGTLKVNGVALIESPDFPEAYAAEARTGAKLLEMARHLAPEQDWTYLSPAPEIAPGEKTGHHSLGADDVIGSNVTTGDFAVAMVDELENPQHSRKRFTVAS